MCSYEVSIIPFPTRLPASTKPGPVSTSHNGQVPLNALRANSCPASFRPHLSTQCAPGGGVRIMTRDNQGTLTGGEFQCSWRSSEAPSTPLTSFLSSSHILPSHFLPGCLGSLRMCPSHWSFAHNGSVQLNVRVSHVGLKLDGA